MLTHDRTDDSDARPAAGQRRRASVLADGLGRLSRLAMRTSRVGIVLFSAVVVAGMLGSVLTGPLGQGVLAQDGYGKRDRDAGIITAVMFGAGAPAAEASRRPRWTAEGRSFRAAAGYTPYRRQYASLRWHAPRVAERRETQVATDAAPRLGGHSAVCVRLCDGYFFPMGDIDRQDDVDSRTSLCAGLCPGAPTRLFVTPGEGRDMNRATAVSTGEAYAGLRVAFAHTRDVGPTCSCHPVDADQATIISPLTDFTMRSGDSIMTPAGWRVFRGADHWPYRRNDFDSVRAARNLSARTRTALVRMEDASLGRRVASVPRPLVVTPKMRVAASSPVDRTDDTARGGLRETLGAP